MPRGQTFETKGLDMGLQWIGGRREAAFSLICIDNPNPMQPHPSPESSSQAPCRNQGQKIDPVEGLGAGTLVRAFRACPDLDMPTQTVLPHTLLPRFSWPLG